MERSETIGAVLAKIALVSENTPPLVKTEENPYYKSKFVNLPTVQETLAPVLTAHKVGVSQPLYGKGIATVVTDLESGEWVLYPAEINSEHLKPQDQMSGVTYLKRYGLIGVFNLVTNDEDDDGNKASGKFRKQLQDEIDTIQ